jgi:uncharacterized repeat protein (TIGR02543 family)
MKESVMKTMKKIAGFTLVLVILALFAACPDPNETDPNKTKPGSDPGKTGSNYTVKFEANGGSPVPDPQSIAKGGKVILPPVMIKVGYGFSGWYTEADCINLWNFTTDTVSDNITLYAKWDVTYTVTFNADGGTPLSSSQTIINGGKVKKPENISKEGCNLEGWYKDASYTNLWNFDSDIVSDNIILYAKWGPPIIVSGNTLAVKLQWLSTNAVSNSSYLLEVTSAYEELASQNLSYNGRNNITIQLKGIGSSRVITLSGNGSLFSIENGVTLILDENLILMGNIQVNSGGKLSMNHSIKINSEPSFGNGVVSVNGGSFTMSGGEISGRASSSSIAVVYISSGTFTMSGGEILGNASLSSYNSVVYVISGSFTMSSGKISGNFSLPSSHSGRGVYVGNGTFTMNGGEISGNSSSPFGGGGVYVGSGTFTMNGGVISGNTTSASNTSDTPGGGGVCVDSGTFIMNDGEISGNSSSSFYGGGVYVGKGTFTMYGGEISGNISESSYTPSHSFYYYGGGGVYVGKGTFTMSGGKISGNTASDSSSGGGGGVFVDYDGTFTMSGGQISGNTTSAPSSGGGGVYVVGTFTMSGGEISDNFAFASSYSASSFSYGGGVYVDNGTFTMSGGEISSNIASSSYLSDSPYFSNSYGGGVYAWGFSVSLFDKTGGIIYGYTAGDRKSNVIKSDAGVIENQGHTVYISHSNDSYIKRKETTAGPTDNLSYIGRLAPPVWAGAWDN